MGFEQFFFQYPGATLSVLLLVAVFLWIRFCYLPFQVWKRNGIHGPSPSFFYGNYKSLNDVGLLKYLEQLHKDYGSNVGFYLGQIPQLSTTDLELIKLMIIKEFDSFINRPPFPNIIGRKKHGLLMSRDKTWRVARQALSPTFSPFKMKAMTPLIQSSVDTLVEVLQNNCDTGRSVEVFRLYGSFTMETLLATAFGRDIDVQRGQSDELTKAAATIFSGAQEGKSTSLLHLNMLLSNLPWLIYIIQFLLRGLQLERQKAYQILQGTASQLILQRQKEPGNVKYQDLLQLMIDATAEDASSNRSRKLTVEEITAHAFTFMMAGYETTANALSYVSYLLALNPHVQEKLQEEIDKFYEENEEVSPYKATQDLEYLDMVVQETLRLYPPVPLLIRECNKAYKYKEMTIPEGCSIMIATHLLQKNPEYWEDPEKFDPMRFSAEAKAERPQHCYMPFGSGPRNCIGMRFALLEAKMALIEILKKFSFIRAPDTQVPLETVLGITMSPKNGIQLRIVSR